MEKSRASTSASRNATQTTSIPSGSQAKSEALALTEAFLAADIPLHKLRNPVLKKYLAERVPDLPCESTCRSKVQEVSQQIKDKIYLKISQTDTNVFVVIDETTIKDTSYVAALIGLIEQPKTTYFACCRVIESTVNAQIICQIVDDVLKIYNVERNRFLLLLTDAAPYMVKAGRKLKFFYPRLSHVLCISHLLHNCCLRIKGHFKDVNSVISCVKAATVKNKSRQSLFREKGIPLPPTPVLTRWGSWLNAALYYSKHLVKVREIFFSITTGGVLVNNAKESLEVETLSRSLTNIASEYSVISTITEEETGVNLTIEKATAMLANLDFGSDSCNVRDYINLRLNSNEINSIIHQTNTALNPAEYSLLQKCQATTVSVERAFSMLLKLLADDRNFSIENIEKHILSKYNSFLI